jgi:hypothetical protein
MSQAAETRVPCSVDTRERLRAAKRGGQTFDELFQTMLDQYDPDAAENVRHRGND